MARTEGDGVIESAMTIGRRRVALSNPNKPLYPSMFTKGEVVAYYLAVAPAMLPYLKGRAVTLKRYPNGTNAEFFFEKRCPAHRPPWVKTAAIARNGETGGLEHCLLNDAASLAWAANLAALELHVPLAKADSPDRPTAVVFDLDPGPPARLLDCAGVAVRMRRLFADLGLDSFPKASGGKGLHVYVPLNTPATFDQTKSFARAVALAFERDDPKHVTATMTRSERPGKVFIDWSQNDRHKTTACAYSLRAGERPTVSAPVTWEEVENAMKKRDASGLRFEASQVIDRVAAYGDLMAPALKAKQRLPSHFHDS